MLLNNKTLEAIVKGDISVVFRVWKRPTVKTGGTLTTRKGVLSILNVEKIELTDVTDNDIKNAGLKSREELCEIDRQGDFYRITVKYKGEDPRIALRRNVDPKELELVCEKLKKMGDWTTQFLQLIHNQPNTHAQILADSVGLEKKSFKPKVRRLKTLGLTESLRPGYRLSPRGERVLDLMKHRST
jgi:hypothetical protein